MFKSYRSIALSTLSVGAVVLLANCAMTSPENTLEAKAGKSWYKGNTHTHTLWSDGDAAPEWVVAWYKENGYDFLSLTDHNRLSRGIFDFPIILLLAS